MAGCGCASTCSPTKKVSPRFRKALWIALVINALMFVVEIVGGYKAQSVSLWADALDFAGDAANYALSLVVLSTGTLVKGITMGAFGFFVIAKVVWSFFHGVSPEPMVMGAIGVIALIANVSVALMLYAFRDGDANMRSVWLCSRNDSIANIAVVLAAVGVFGTGTIFPDLFVAFVIAYLGVSSGYTVIKQSLQERKQSKLMLGSEA